MIVMGFAQEFIIDYSEELSSVSERVETQLMQSQNDNDEARTSCLEERYDSILRLIDVMAFVEKQYQASPKSLRVKNAHHHMMTNILEQAFNIETSADLCAQNYEEDNAENMIIVEGVELSALEFERYQSTYVESSRESKTLK